MTQQIFSSLPVKKRCDLLWEEGQFLDTVRYYRLKASLYSFKSFFVEVLCQPDTTEIEKVEIATEDKLVKYLNRIDVEKMMGKE